MTARVLCAVDIDHPEHDKLVLHRAAQLATLDNAELDVITVLPGFGMSVVGSFFPDDAEAKMVEHATETLNVLIGDAFGPAAADKVQRRVVVGRTYKEILKTADAIGASLIVIGSGRDDIKDFLLGPNAARVARHADCSVHIVRLPPEHA